MSEEIGEPMQLALEQAWESFRNGSFPVGTVLLMADQSLPSVVIEWENRRLPMADCDLRVWPTPMDVLAQLPMGDYAGHTLVTTLEPCLLCRSAATMAHVGRVEFLAADSICNGLEALPGINEHAKRWYPIMRGPAKGDAADFASILPMAVLVLFGPTGDAASHYRTHSPREFAVADAMVRENRWPGRELTVDAAIAHVAGFAASIVEA